MSEFNPIKTLTSMGKLNPAEPKSVPVPKATGDLIVRYEVYNVNDQTEKDLLCEAKKKILINGFSYKEETTFDKSANWIVALNWYESVEEAE
jgi:hypothetical protein